MRKIIAACKECEGPGKVVWPMSSARPHLAKYEESGWFSLTACVDCGRMWLQSPYEPYASFIYLIYWPYSREFWSSVVSVENGAAMAKWSDFKIREAWPTMSEQDRAAVAFHRQRSFGRNPIDERPDEQDVDPLVPFLAAAGVQPEA